MKKGAIIVIAIVFILVTLSVFLFFRNGKDDKKTMEEAIIKQLDMEPSESIDLNEPESYINLDEDVSITELHDLIREKCNINVEEIKKSSVILEIESVDMRKIIEESKDLVQIVKKIKSEESPKLKSRVEVHILENSDTPVIEKSAELLDAVYGGLPTLFGIGG